MPPPPTPHDPLLLALDAGTQGVRAIVFEAGGNPRAASPIALAPAFVAPQPGWAEQDPQGY